MFQLNQEHNNINAQKGVKYAVIDKLVPGIVV